MAELTLIQYFICGMLLGAILTTVHLRRDR